MIAAGATFASHGGLDSFLGGIAGSGLVTGIASGFSYSDAPRAPPTPQGFWDTVWDIASFGYSLHQFRQNPGWGTGLGLFADTLALLAPGVPGGAGFVAKAGRLGGVAHRAKVAERATELERTGYKIIAGGGRIPERGFRTIEGKLRFPDITALDVNGKIYFENIGRVTKSGTPVARERRALEDLRTIGRTEFSAYNQ